MRKLTGIYIYPIKSLGGISLTECMTEERGLRYDRRWMLVDEKGMFMSQRKWAKMTLFQPNLVDEGIVVAAPDGDQALIPFQPKTNEQVNVQVWDSHCDGFIVSDELNNWFTEKIGVSCRLVYMADAERKANPSSVRNDEKVSYADGYPYLVVGQEAMLDLNSRLEQPVPIHRFRPNLVFSGGDSFEEDSWNDFTIGDANFYGVKPCARCIMTTIDHMTGEKKSGEPLKTLSTYRKVGSKVNFGLNACAIDDAIIKLGDEIIIHNKK